jgi:hypothetical protein
MLNGVLVVVLAMAASAAVAVWIDVRALRRVAAWALARALYLEFLRAERVRLRELAREFEVERRLEFGVAEREEVASE